MNIDVNEMEQMSYKWFALSQQRLQIEDKCEELELDILLDSFENNLRMTSFCVIAQNEKLRLRFDIRIAEADEIANLSSDMSFQILRNRYVSKGNDGRSYEEVIVNDSTSLWVHKQTTAFTLTSEVAA